MTVCIAAVCSGLNGEGRAAAVVACDHMVTLGDFMKFEHDVPKMRTITNTSVMAIAGDALRGAVLVEHVAKQFTVGAHSILDIAQTAASCYESLRREALDGQLFRPRGFTMRDFYVGGLQNQLVSGLVSMLDSEVSSFSLGVDSLIAGVDSTGAHVFGVGNPGVMNDYQQIGYAALGSGSIHAVQSLIGFGHSGRQGLFETLFCVYASKRRAEVAVGVGERTDLTIILPNQIVNLNEDQLKKLEEFYQEYQQPITNKLEARIRSLNLFEGNNNDERDDEPIPADPAAAKKGGK